MVSIEVKVNCDIKALIPVSSIAAVIVETPSRLLQGTRDPDVQIWLHNGKILSCEEPYETVKEAIANARG